MQHYFGHQLRLCVSTLRSLSCGEFVFCVDATRPQSGLKPGSYISSIIRHEGQHWMILLFVFFLFFMSVLPVCRKMCTLQPRLCLTSHSKALWVLTAEIKTLSTGGEEDPCHTTFQMQLCIFQDPNFPAYILPFPVSFSMQSFKMHITKRVDFNI